MAKKFIIGVVLVLVGISGWLVYQKSQVKPLVKVDLSTQPNWVQKLEVTARKGQSANGLENVTVLVKGLVNVESINYVLQYQTSNKGAQGALSSKPIEVTGTTFSKTIDLGTCSTKSCVRHEGVTSIDLELDFTTSDGSKSSWSKTLDLK
ncbi:hypothetical protein HY085_00145 [Candidatus Gottesmanbacteria bacterium]|nr:hypothetical protein [Candidatus Gottesmanbacteria bacterium]